MSLISATDAPMTYSAALPTSSAHPSRQRFDFWPPPCSVSADCHGEMLCAAIHRASPPSRSPRCLTETAASFHRRGIQFSLSPGNESFPPTPGRISSNGPAGGRMSGCVHHSFSPAATLPFAARWSDTGPTMEAGAKNAPASPFRPFAAVTFSASARC